MGQLSAGLEVDGLGKQYGSRPILSVDLHLKPGDFCLLLGENGAGKSTFFRCLLGLEKHTGRVSVSGRPGPRGVRGLLDEPLMYPRWTTTQNLRYLRNDPRAERDPMVRRLVDESLLRQRVGRLSTGQKKMVALSSVLSLDARVVLLDEFANGLDRAARARFRAALHAHVTERQAIVVATGHELDAFAELPNRVFALRGGRLFDLTAAYRDGGKLEALYEEHVVRASS